MKCVHPWAKTEDVGRDVWEEDSGSVKFVFCSKCKSVIWGKVPNPIPHDWEDSQVRVRAHELLGYTILPAPPPRKWAPGNHHSTLADILTKTYSLQWVKEMQELEFPVFTKVKTK